MSEWWTYTLQDFLLFSPRTYYRQFELYNLAIWPGQIVALAAGLAVLRLLWRPSERSGAEIALLLAIAWSFVAGAYFFTRYATINWIAPCYAAGFVIQAMLLVWIGVARRRLRFTVDGTTGNVGLCIYLFALLIMPLTGPFLGRPLPQAELFGLAPDPTAIATLGLLLIAPGRHVISLLIIPVLWCAVSAATLWTMGSPNAWIMMAAPVICIVAVLFKILTFCPQRE